MKIKHQVVVFDAAELAAESEFWAGMLGGTVAAEAAPLREPYRVDLALGPDLQRHAALPSARLHESYRAPPRYQGRHAGAPRRSPVNISGPGGPGVSADPGS